MAWKIGIGSNSADRFRGFDVQAGDNAGGYFAVTRWNCQPGQKTLTSISGRWAFLANCPAMYVMVYSKSGSTLTLVGSEQITFTATDSTQTVTDSSLSLQVDLESGGEYYFGMFAQRPSSDGNGQPGIRLFNNAGAGVLAANETILLSLSGVTSPPTTVLTSAGSNPQVINEVPCFTMTYTSDNLVEYDSGEGFDGTNLIVPIPSGETGYIHLGDWQVADTATGTVDLRETTATTTASNAAAYVDFSGTGELTFAGNTNAITDQADHVFDMAMRIDAGNTAGDLIYMNKTEGQGPQTAVGAQYRDIAALSHYAVQNAARSSYTFTGSGYLAFSGTKPDRVRICKAEALVILAGDSNIGTKASAGAAASLTRLGAAINTLDSTRVYWNAGISGSRIAADVASGSTSLIQRHQNSTPGQGDLVALEGATLALIAGLNDISANVSDAATAASYPTTLMTSVGTIGTNAAAANQNMVLFGLPPYSAAVANISHKGQAILNFNNALYSYAAANGLPSTSPWNQMWSGQIDANGAYVFADQYTQDAGTHYNTAGAAKAAAILLKAILGQLSNAGNSKSRGGANAISGALGAAIQASITNSIG